MMPLDRDTRKRRDQARKYGRRAVHLNLHETSIPDWPPQALDSRFFAVLAASEAFAAYPELRIDDDGNILDERFTTDSDPSFRKDLTVPTTLVQYAAVLIPEHKPGERVAYVHFRRKGYSLSSVEWDTWTLEQCREVVDYINGELGVPREVEETMLAGSMFGWDSPAAAAAIAHFEPPAPEEQ